MSYSFQHTLVKSDDVATDVARLADQVTVPDHARVESGLSITAALEAAGRAAAAVGRPGDHLRVEVGGHANEENAPADGWADEFVFVRVGVVQPD